MANFLFAYRGGNGMATTPEARERVMAEWGAWFATLGSALVDGGKPFAQSQTVHGDGPHDTRRRERLTLARSAAAAKSAASLHKPAQQQAHRARGHRASGVHGDRGQVVAGSSRVAVVGAARSAGRDRTPAPAGATASTRTNLAGTATLSRTRRAGTAGTPTASSRPRRPRMPRTSPSPGNVT
jgi:hypothetical protein